MEKNIILRSGYSFGGFLSRAVDAKLLSPTLEASANFVHASVDEKWMHEALLVAMHQVGVPSPNPAVGCVIVKEGKIVVAGGTERFGGLHAERSALSKVAAADQVKGATAYVTLEPCSHFGKQPPCVQALIGAGIQRCVVAAKDINPLVSGQGIAALRTAGIQVDVGTLRNECIAYNYPFFAAQALGRPIFFGKWAQTMDGFLADDEQDSKWISSSISRSYTHWLRQKYDAIMVGAGTLLNDLPELTARTCAEPINRQPLKIVFDPHGRLATAAPEVLQQVRKTSLAAERGKVIYAACAPVFSQPSSAALQKWLADNPHILPLRLDADAYLDDFITQLHGDDVTSFYGLKLQSVLVEGGPLLLNALIEKNVIDCFHTFIAPGFLGATTNRIGRSVAKNPLTRTIEKMTRYHLMAVTQMDSDVLMEYLPPDRYERIFGE